MHKLKLKTAIDGLFIFFATFFIYYSIIKSRLQSVISTATISATLSSLTTLLFMIFLYFWDEKKGEKAGEIEKLNAFNEYLYFLRDDELKTLLYKLFKKMKIDCEKKTNAFIFKEKNAILFCNFSPEKTSINTILKFYKNANRNCDLYFLACDYSSDVFPFFSNFEKIKLHYTKDLLTLLNKYNLTPTLDEKKITKIKLKTLIKSIFRRENTKKFFIWGVVFSLFSTITYYKFFYALLGATFLITALYLKFFKSEEKLN